jgi:hypothetical protein
MTAETNHREAVFATPVQAGNLTITPLVEIRVEAKVDEPVTRGEAAMEPIGVLVDGPSGTRAYALDGTELPTMAPEAGDAP